MSVGRYVCKRYPRTCQFTTDDPKVAQYHANSRGHVVDDSSWNGIVPVGAIVHIEPVELPVAAMSSDINPPTTRAEADELRRQLMTLPKGCLQKLYTDLYDGMDMRIDAARREGELWYKELGK